MSAERVEALRNALEQIQKTRDWFIATMEG
jgi:hypothetical protein